MGQLVIISVIASAIITILLVPLTRKIPKSELTARQQKVLAIFVFIIGVISVFSFIYISKIDLHWTIFIYALPVVALVGAIFSVGLEQKVKSAIVLVGIIAVVYLLSAPVFNATDKYNSAEMTEGVEIQPFDETKTPASVPPQYVENKMKKAFAQVPNTSFYELGNLQIQKVNGEYVYIAPVEFSGFFKWFKGKTTPGYFTMSATDASAESKIY